MQLNHGVAGGISVTGVIVSFCTQNLPVVQFLAAVIAIVVGLPHAIRITKSFYERWVRREKR